jgi:hypothetical protein
VFGADPAPDTSRSEVMAAQKSINTRGRQLPAPQQARVPKRANSCRARTGLRKLAAGLGIAVLALLPASASPTAGGVLPPGTAHFVDHGGPILHTAQIHLLYWGGHWPATGIYFPTTTQITAALQTLLVGPYLNGLAQYRHIQPAVLRSSTIVTTSNPHNGFDDHDIAAFLNTQFDAGVVPGPDPDNQSLYLVVLPVGISASGYRYEFDGEHDYYTRHGQRIHFVWAAASGRLDSATRIISHELVEAITDPEGSAIRGVSRICDQEAWCEIADVCFDTSLVNGVAVSPYWSEQAHACVVPNMTSTPLRPQSRAARGTPTIESLRRSPRGLVTAKQFEHRDFSVGPAIP